MVVELVRTRSSHRRSVVPGGVLSRDLQAGYLVLPAVEVKQRHMGPLDLEYVNASLKHTRPLFKSHLFILALYLLFLGKVIWEGCGQDNGGPIWSSVTGWLAPLRRTAHVTEELLLRCWKNIGRMQPGELLEERHESQTNAGPRRGPVQSSDLKRRDNQYDDNGD